MRLALPLLLELSLGVAAGVLGTVLAGQIADASAAAFALSMQFFHTAFLLFRIVGAGISVVLSQQLGYNNPIAAETAARTALLASFVMGLIAAAVLWFGSDRLLLHFEVPEEVRLQAKPLMLWLAPCVLLDALVVAMASVMRAHLFAAQSLRVMMLMHLCHWGLAWLLMSGSFGLSGFAMASLVSRILSLVLLTRCWDRYLGIKTIWITPDAGSSLVSGNFADWTTGCGRECCLALGVHGIGCGGVATGHNSTCNPGLCSSI